MANQTKYNLFFKQQLDGGAVIDFDNDTLKVMIVTNTYVPSATTHDFINDVTNEVSGTNYVAGGNQVTGITVTESSGTVTVDGNNVTWLQDASGFTDGRFAILYKDTGTPTTSPLVSFTDFTADKGNVSGDLSIEWNALGIFTV